MNCEICGVTIYGPPKKIVIEGSRLLVCIKCSNLGEPDFKSEERVLDTPSRPSPSRPLGSPKTTKTAGTRLPREVEELEISEDFPKIIKKAREKNKMSQQDLARAVKERLSIIQKIELGKMTPNLKLTHEFEHTLKVKLLLPRIETEVKTEKSGKTGLTLGDLIHYKKKEQ